MSAIAEGASRASDSGIAHADLLIRFAEALVAYDEAALAKLRGPITEAVGPEDFLEAAAVAANFQRMVRIADSTGTPQDAPVMALAGDAIDQLGLRDFPPAANTPPTSMMARVIGPLIRPFAAKIRTLNARLMKSTTANPTLERLLARR
ncbi:MAG: hypothetical protein P8R42_05295 [Candidatus Binatia bacterium]|nr:hypothetical protein [Candidatus Binatia bacterium]